MENEKKNLTGEAISNMDVGSGARKKVRKKRKKKSPTAFGKKLSSLFWSSFGFGIVIFSFLLGALLFRNTGTFFGVSEKVEVGEKYIVESYTVDEVEGGGYTVEVYTSNAVTGKGACFFLKGLDEENIAVLDKWGWIWFGTTKWVRYRGTRKFRDRSYPTYSTKELFSVVKSKTKVVEPDVTANLGITE
jgi:hypothetical protein